MKPFTQLGCLTMVFIAFLALSEFTVAADQWLTLAEVKKKWDGVPVEKVKQAAEGGDLTAQHYLGYSFSSGERVPKNGAEAVSWYQRALKAGYLPSAVNLGLLYRNGEIVPRDLAKAVDYTRTAANQGMDQAQVNLGVFYQEGTGVPQDLKESFRWFSRAAKQGHTDGMVNVGCAYRFGNGVEKNVGEAIKWFEKAAQAGNPAGTFNLGLLYEEEAGFQDEQKALELYHQAADRGSAEAMFKLYQVSNHGQWIIQNEEARQWLTKSAEAGYGWAQAELGCNFEYMNWDTFQEEAGSNNMPVAILWYHRSADQGWSGGEYRLGLCYLNGKGVEWDEERGLELIRKAADQDHSYALYQLADMYAHGIGEPRSSDDRPFVLLMRAAKLNCSKAYGALSGRYGAGLGVDRDFVKGAEWYCRASDASVGGYHIADNMFNDEQSHDPFRATLALYLKAIKRHNNAAAERIGDLYLTGDNVPINPEEAWAWFQLAATQGDSKAAAKLPALQTKLTPQQMTAARDRMVELKKSVSESQGIPMAE